MKGMVEIGYWGEECLEVVNRLSTFHTENSTKHTQISIDKQRITTQHTNHLRIPETATRDRMPTKTAKKHRSKAKQPKGRQSQGKRGKKAAKKSSTGKKAKTMGKKSQEPKTTKSKLMGAAGNP